MATLFGKARNTITEHIQNVYEEGELEQNPPSRKFRQVRTEGKRVSCPCFTLQFLGGEYLELN